jgi:restriction endonuclease Mrr
MQATGGKCHAETGDQIELIDGKELINKFIEYGLIVKEWTIYEIDKKSLRRCR